MRPESFPEREGGRGDVPDAGFSNVGEGVFELVLSIETPFMISIATVKSHFALLANTKECVNMLVQITHMADKYYGAASPAMQAGMLSGTMLRRIEKLCP